MVYPNKYTDSQVEILGELGVSKQLSASTTSARIALTSTTKRVSIKAVGADMRYTFGGSTIEATTTSHYIADGERLDFACLEGTYIAVETISGTGVLEITELV
jgi:hypothetical protein